MSRETAACGRDLDVALAVEALPGLDPRRHEVVLLEPPREVGRDPGTGAELGEIELAASLPERGRPAGRPRRALGVERLADHPEREELVPLEPQDGLESLDVLVGEEPIAAPGPPRPEQALILEVTDLRDRDVGKLLA